MQCPFEHRDTSKTCEGILFHKITLTVNIGIGVNSGRNSLETQLVTSSYVRLWQEVVLKFRYT